MLCLDHRYWFRPWRRKKAVPMPHRRCHTPRERQPAAIHTTELEKHHKQVIPTSSGPPPIQQAHLLIRSPNGYPPQESKIPQRRSRHKTCPCPGETTGQMRPRKEVGRWSKQAPSRQGKTLTMCVRTWARDPLRARAALVGDDCSRDALIRTIFPSSGFRCLSVFVRLGLVVFFRHSF